jgi:hypothetical protein
MTRRSTPSVPIVDDSGLIRRFTHRRFWTALALYAGLGGCVAPAHRAPDPRPDATDFQRREECLHREVARLISERGDKPTTLEGIAVTATALCSQEIWIKMAKNNFGPADDFLMAGNDKAQTERYALEVVMEIKKMRSKK